MLWAPPAFAFLTTGLQEQISWSIAGVDDADIRYVSRFSSVSQIDYFYAAPLRPLIPQMVSAAIHPTVCFITNGVEYCLAEANLTLSIPSFGAYSYTYSTWSGQPWGTDPGTISLVHGALYTHETASQMTRIFFSGIWMPNPTNAQVGRFKQISINVFPLEDLYGYQGVEDVPWLKGFPDYSAFAPSVRVPPLGCGLCSRQGLPVFRVNTTVLNPLVWDTDFASAGPGPEIRLTRTYNADANVAGIFGRSWSFSYEWVVDSQEFGAVLKQGSGRSLLFALNTNTTVYAVPAGERGRLSWTPAVAGRPGYGAFQYYDPAARLLYQFETPWFGGPGHPPLTNAALTFISDLNSNKVALSYTNGRIRQVQDAAGRAITLQYNMQQCCTNITTPDGHALAYSYNASGNLARARDALGNETDYSYAGDHSLTGLNTEGRAWSFEYLNPGLVGTLVDPLGNTNRFAMPMAQVSNRQVRVYDARGNYTLHASRNGMSWKQTDPLGNTLYTTYENGYPAAITNARGFVTRQVFDARGNLIRRTLPDGAVTAYGYDANDWLVAATNAVGGVTRFEYDACGNLVRLTRPSGRQTVMTYDARGLMRTRRDAGSNTVGWTYDALGNPTVFSNELGHATHYAYDPAGLRCMALTNARGHALQFTWDANGRPLRTTLPDGSYRERQYDCCAESAFVDERGNRVSVVRDALLHPIRQVDARGGTNSFAYDANGNRVRAENALGQSRIFSYDENNRIASITNAAGNQEAWYAYDANGNISMMSARALNFNFTYDASDRLQRIHDGLYARSFAYDALGRLAFVTNARGQQIGREYDADGRLTRITHQGQPFAVFEHNAAGAMSRMTDAWGTNRYDVDRSRAVTNILYPDGYTAAFRYDPVGNLASIRYPGGWLVAYQYDSRNRVTNMAWGAQWLRFQYDAAGNLVSEERSGGAGSTYGYDAGNYLTSLLHRAGATTLVQLRYDRDRLAQITNTVKIAGLMPCLPVYTNAAQVFTYARPGCQETWDGAPVTYDPDGNRTNIAGGVGESALYDPENRMVRMTRGGITITNVYNGLGQRVQSARSNAVRRAHYDPIGRLLFETDGSGALVALYFYRDDALVALCSSAGITHFHLFDAMGSTMALVDQHGALSAIYRYLPYGAVASRFERVENRFTFVGRHGVEDDGAGLFHMRTRAYDARTGRFLQRDPIGLFAGDNLHAYAANNPINRMDPLGLTDIANDFPEPDDCQVREGTYDIAQNEEPAYFDDYYFDEEFFELAKDRLGHWMKKGSPNWNEEDWKKNRIRAPFQGPWWDKPARLPQMIGEFFIKIFLEPLDSNRPSGGGKYATTILG